MRSIRRPIDAQHARARKALLESVGRAVEFVDAGRTVPMALLQRVAADLANELAIAEVKKSLRPRGQS
jgi:hypothetical protein